MGVSLTSLVATDIHFKFSYLSLIKVYCILMTKIYESSNKTIVPVLYWMFCISALYCLYCVVHLVALTIYVMFCSQIYPPDRHLIFFRYNHLKIVNVSFLMFRIFVLTHVGFCYICHCP